MGPGWDYDKTPFAERARLLLKHSTFFVFGTEESYGYLPNDYVRDKDGNAACLMFAELCAWVAGRGLTVPEYLDQIYLKYGFYLEDTINIYYEGASGSAKIRRILDTYRTSRPARPSGTSEVTGFQDFGRERILDADGDEIPKQDLYIASPLERLQVRGPRQRHRAQDEVLPLRVGQGGGPAALPAVKARVRGEARPPQAPHRGRRPRARGGLNRRTGGAQGLHSRRPCRIARQDSSPMAIVPGLRSPYAKVGRLVYFGRMLDKIRLHAQGRLPADYLENIGDAKPGMFYTRCCALLGVSYDEIRRRTLEGASDEAVLEWVEHRGARLERRGMRHVERLHDEARIPRLGRRHQAPEAARSRRRASRASHIETYFDYIDFDEGRDPAANGLGKPCRLEQQEGRRLEEVPQGRQEGRAHGAVDDPVVAESVSDILWPMATWSPLTTGFRTAAPTARIAALGGLIIAQNRSIPIIPRFETQKVPPVNSSGASFLSRALLPSALASVLIAKRVFRWASLMTGVIRPSASATANDTWAAGWWRIGRPPTSSSPRARGAAPRPMPSGRNR